MIRPYALLLAAVLLLPACLDPLVGSKCATGYEPCANACVPSGTCTIVDAGTIDADLSPIDATQIVDGEWDSDRTGQQDAEWVDTSDLAPDAETTDAPEEADAPVEPDVPVGPDAPVAEDTRDARVLPKRDGRDSPIPVLVEDAEAMDLVADAATIDAEQDAAPTDAEQDAGEDATFADATDAADAADDAPEDAVEVDLAPPELDGPLTCSEPLEICGEQCVDPLSDPEHCGDCNVMCESGVCNEGTCLVCGPEQSVCNRQCVSTSVDPDNCGGCGIPCISGLCSNGQCEAAGTGRAIVIGHDYLRNRPAMNRILGNAVFLWPVNPVRLLVYEGSANAYAVAGADSAIAQVAAATGRLYGRTVVSAADVPAQLPASDVLLIYSQENATDDALSQVGQAWAESLATFVARGGTLVVLDGVYAANAGTSQILVAAGLFQVARGVSITGDVCTVTARGDALATGLPRTYLCERNSTTLLVTDPGTVTPVIQDGDAVVVVHKVF